ncbi:superinfection immunity protein [Klebsiella pneumoniae]
MSGGVILFLILLVVYFIPAIIASNRKHSNSGAIACLNIFLGWTFIGWVVALVWAFTDNVKKD